MNRIQRCLRRLQPQPLLLGAALLPLAAHAQPPAPVVPLDTGAPVVPLDTGAPAVGTPASSPKNAPAPAGTVSAAPAGSISPSPAGTASAALAAPAAIAYRVELNAPADVAPLLQNNLAIIKQQSNAEMTLPYLQRLYQDTPAQVTQLLNTEGYYKPDIRTSLQQAGGAWVVRLDVVPGALTHVRQVTIHFAGAIATPSPDNEKQEAQARSQWAVKTGDVFRQAQWEAAKKVLLLAIQAYRYPAARISSSQATVNPDTGLADLSIEIDSGPAFTFGDLHVEGLKRYPLVVVHNLSEINPGAPYDQAQLVALQNKLQGSPYFLNATVSAPADPAHPLLTPINITVVERRAKHLNAGVGYGTDTGPRVRAGYQDNNLFGKGWRWDTRTALAQKVQVLSSGIIMPTAQPGVSNAVGAEYAHLNIQNDNYQTLQFGVSRSRTHGDITHTLAENYVFERDTISGIPSFDTRALFTNYTWTKQHVDNVLDPQHGYVVSAQLGGALKALGSDTSFIRGYAKASWFHPLGANNTLILRGELGAVNAGSHMGIPTALMFRTGGIQSVRGYDYLSLGPRLNNAVIGGRYLAVASAEVDHWFTDKYGGAVFMDAGNAADTLGGLKLRKSVGAGFRWRSPVGLVRVDLGHALDDVAPGVSPPRFRIDASLGYTF